MDEEIFDKKSLAKYLKVELKTIKYLSDTKRIPYFKVGRHIRFRKQSILEWAKENEVFPGKINEHHRSR